MTQGQYTSGTIYLRYNSCVNLPPRGMGRLTSSKSRAHTQVGILGAQNLEPPRRGENLANQTKKMFTVRHNTKNKTYRVIENKTSRRVIQREERTRRNKAGGWLYRSTVPYSKNNVGMTIQYMRGKYSSPDGGHSSANNCHQWAGIIRSRKKHDERD